MQSATITSITDLEELICNIFLAGHLTSAEYIWLLNTSSITTEQETDHVLIERVLYGIRHGLLQITDPT